MTQQLGSWWRLGSRCRRRFLPVKAQAVVRAASAQPRPKVRVGAAPIGWFPICRRPKIRVMSMLILVLGRQGSNIEDGFLQFKINLTGSSNPWHIIKVPQIQHKAFYLIQGQSSSTRIEGVEVEKGESNAAGN